MVSGEREEAEEEVDACMHEVGRRMETRGATCQHEVRRGTNQSRQCQCSRQCISFRCIRSSSAVSLLAGGQKGKKTAQEEEYLRSDPIK